MAFNSQSKEEEEVFVDADEYHASPEQAVTYEQIVVQQIKKCIEEGSKEMTGGYYKEKQTSKGAIDIYVGDQQAIFINSILSLRRLLLFHYDKEMKEYEKKHNTSLNEIEDKAKQLLKDRLLYIDDERIKNNINTQILTGYLDPDLYEARWSSDEKLKAYGLLLEELIKLYNRKRWLMTQDIDDRYE